MTGGRLPELVTLVAGAFRHGDDENSGRRLDRQFDDLSLEGRLFPRSPRSNHRELRHCVAFPRPRRLTREQRAIAGAIFVFISAIDETIVALLTFGGQYQQLAERLFAALRDEINPAVAAISTLMTAVCLTLVLVVNSRPKKRSTRLEFSRSKNQVAEAGADWNPSRPGEWPGTPFPTPCRDRLRL